MDRQKFFTERRNLFLAYGIAFTLGLVIFAIGLAGANWEEGPVGAIQQWLTNPVVFPTLLFSTTVVRILAGFGLIATYIAVFEALLALFSRIAKTRRITNLMKGVKISDLLKRDKLAEALKGLKITESLKREKISDAVKGKKISEVLAGRKGRRARIAGVVFFFIIVPFAILAYVTFRFISVLAFGASQTLFDVAYLLVGIWGLLLSLYLIPIFKKEPIALTGKLGEIRDKLKEVEIRKGLNNLKSKITNVYVEKVPAASVDIPPQNAVETYAEAFAWDHVQDYAEELDKIEFENVRTTMLAYRSKISDDLLLPIAIASIIVPPVALLFFVVFIRAFFLRKEVGRDLLERVILLASVVMAGLYASIEIIFSPLTIGALVSFDYLIGAVLGCLFFLLLARKAI